MLKLFRHRMRLCDPAPPARVTGRRESTVEIETPSRSRTAQPNFAKTRVNSLLLDGSEECLAPALKARHRGNRQERKLALEIQQSEPDETGGSFGHQGNLRI